MQSLWRPPNLHHHPNSSCPSPAPTGITAAAHTHKATIAFNPSSKPKGVSSSPRFANGGWRMVWCYSSSGVVGCVEVEKEVIGGDEYLVRNSGWGVRRMVEQWDEMRSVAFVQAEAFHVPLALFDDIFFKFFQAEVLSALLYRVRNSPPNRYACLVAEPVDGPNLKMSSGIVGVVDITVQRDADVLTYLDEEEYIYVSGIAVLKKCRTSSQGERFMADSLRRGIFPDPDTTCSYLLGEVYLYCWNSFVVACSSWPSISGQASSYHISPLADYRFAV